MDMNSAPVTGYTQHACIGDCVGGKGTGEMGSLPTIQDIAGYNAMPPQQQEQQRQQLHQASESTFGGLPFQVSSRWMANNPSQSNSSLPATKEKQIMAGTQAVQGAAEMQMLQGTTSAPLIPGQTTPITPTSQPTPITGESLQYLNGFLRTQIGRAVQVEFLIGTNTLIDRTGILLGVGANYILINEAETDDIVACDFYNIKFVKFYY